MTILKSQTLVEMIHVSVICIAHTLSMNQSVICIGDAIHFNQPLNTLTPINTKAPFY